MPTTQRTGKPRKGLAPLPAITPPETALDALARLNDEAWRGILKSVPDLAAQLDAERLARGRWASGYPRDVMPLDYPEVGVQEGDPVLWHPYEDTPCLDALDAARRHAALMVDRLIAFLDATEGDPDSKGDDDPSGGCPTDDPGQYCGYGSESDSGWGEGVSQLEGVLEREFRAPEADLGWCDTGSQRILHCGLEADELDTLEGGDLDVYGESDGDFDLDASCLTVCEGCEIESYDGVEPASEDEYGGHSEGDPRAAEMARKEGKRALDKSLARGQRVIIGEGGRVTIVGPDFRPFLVTDLR